MIAAPAIGWIPPKSGASKKRSSTHDVRSAMRGSVARRLRKIAASFGLPEETQYAPGGPLRRRSPKLMPDGTTQAGAPIPRPFVLRACQRLVYKHAKQAFKGKPLSSLQPEPAPERKQVEQTQEFRDNVAESARVYASN
jgi:hypothetical protein